jgi:hypothetical protein
MPAMLGHLFNGNSIKKIAGAGNRSAIDGNSSVEKSDKCENKDDSKKDTENDNNNNDNNNANNSSNNNSCATISKNKIKGCNNGSSGSNSSSSNNTNTSTNNRTSNTEGDNYSGFHFLGTLLSDDVACAVADGTMDPITLVRSLLPPSI